MVLSGGSLLLAEQIREKESDTGFMLPVAVALVERGVEKVGALVEFPSNAWSMEPLVGFVGRGMGDGRRGGGGEVVGSLAVGFNYTAFANMAEELHGVPSLEPAEASRDVRRIHEHIMVFAVLSAECADDAEVGKDTPSFHDSAES